MYNSTSLAHMHDASMFLFSLFPSLSRPCVVDAKCLASVLHHGLNTQLLTTSSPLESRWLSSTITPLALTLALVLVLVLVLARAPMPID